MSHHTFFFGLERKNGQKRLIHSLKLDSGQVLSDHAAIREHAVSFYSNLYKCEHQDEQVIAQSFLYWSSSGQRRE